MLQIIVSIGSFLLGLLLLLYGADSLVRGASSIAKKAGLSALFIGLTIVSFGTSLPELMVNVMASLRGSNDIAIGNVLGSNISNILLILGISASIYPLSVKKGTVSKEIPFSLLAVAALFFLVNDALLNGNGFSILSRADGLVLLLFFIIFMYYTVGISRKSDADGDHPVKSYPHYLAASMVLGGMIGLFVGGNLLVDGAIKLAQSFGLSEALIGLTVVAVGTSLPELATSAVAAYRRQSDIAIGNIVGSNIFNIFWILGFSAIIKPLHFSLDLNIDLVVVMAATILLVFFSFIGKRNVIQRWNGTFLVSLYFIYIVYLVLRG